MKDAKNDVYKTHIRDEKVDKIGWKRSREERNIVKQFDITFRFLVFHIFPPFFSFSDT